jgi:hypothetical protein
VQRLPPLCYRFGPDPVAPISTAAAWQRKRADEVIE